ncbi:endo alpha-1,4 polygalactosaminidase [Solirubrobacter deserti]|uniref:Endo alpha-1,4 polygalactosaminidase n=1 Tax=Solirubrobacter deserti TaxID=2282478 RepID=A0ABT4RF98_9ACTN|nr:endo alpha-1,4 polygalactosaminidase [Solirubrobacter deserti]MDA0137197.1 endo alpha-1,4 polygalactosaminidase [Solirubrobacter deserti]
MIALIAAVALAVPWAPPPTSTFQWQLSGRLDLSVRADLYDVDLFETSAADVARIHAMGARAACYFSAGTHEPGRPDSKAFPRSVIGQRLADWPRERWLDVRRLSVLRPIMRRRLNLCAEKGFDAVEPDNVDGYANDSGFALRGRHQLRFNRWLARAAHARGLSIALKNDLEQVRALEPWYDWALSEECFAYRECARLKPFADAGKAVFVVEYADGGFCPAARDLGFMAQRKRLALDAWREPCW